MTSVLFVDDERRLLDGLRRSLWSRREEWDMAFMDDGAAALEHLSARAVDVVVSDFRMPGMDGREFLQAVRRQSPDSVRLVLSGHTEERDLLSLVGVAHQFLVKPCRPQDLVGLVDRMISIRGDCAAGLRSSMTAIGSLPSSDGTLAHLARMADDRCLGDDDITRVLEQDVALAAKVFQIANSAFFAPASRTTSIGAAVRRLGPIPIRGLAGELLRSCGPEPTADHSRVTELHLHAAEAAAKARSGPNPTDDAFCAALLHVAGPLAVAAGPHRVAAQAGAYLLRLWGIPDDVVATATATALECKECPR